MLITLLSNDNAKKAEYYIVDFIQSVDDGDSENGGDNDDHLQGVQFLVDHCNALRVPCALVGHSFQLFCNLQ